jgi:hypothetical protein
MATPVNVDFDLANAGTKTIILNRWGYPSYSAQVSAGSALVEGTLQRENRGEAPVWFTLDDTAGTALTAVTSGIVDIQNSPLEAIRITATGATVGRVMQTGG